MLYEVITPLFTQYGYPRVHALGDIGCGHVLVQVEGQVGMQARILDVVLGLRNNFV